MPRRSIGFAGRRARWLPRLARQAPRRPPLPCSPQHFASLAGPAAGPEVASAGTPRCISDLRAQDVSKHQPGCSNTRTCTYTVQAVQVMSAAAAGGYISRWPVTAIRACLALHILLNWASAVAPDITPLPACRRRGLVSADQLLVQAALSTYTVINSSGAQDTTYSGVLGSKVLICNG